MRKTAQEEMDALHKNNIWTLIELPKGKNTIGSREQGSNGSELFGNTYFLLPAKSHRVKKVGL